MERAVSGKPETPRHCARRIPARSQNRRGTHFLSKRVRCFLSVPVPCLCLDHIPHIALSFAFSLLSGAQWVCFAIPEPPTGCPDTISIHPMFHLSSDHDIDHRQLTPCAFGIVFDILGGQSPILRDLCP